MFFLIKFLVVSPIQTAMGLGNELPTATDTCYSMDSSSQTNGTDFKTPTTVTVSISNTKVRSEEELLLLMIYFLILIQLFLGLLWFLVNK